LIDNFVIKSPPAPPERAAVDEDDRAA
jgi:hypothetical protein